MSYHPSLPPPLSVCMYYYKYSTLFFPLPPLSPPPFPSPPHKNVLSTFHPKLFTSLDMNYWIHMHIRCTTNFGSNDCRWYKKENNIDVASSSHTDEPPQHGDFTAQHFRTKEAKDLYEQWCQYWPLR